MSKKYTPQRRACITLSLLAVVVSIVIFTAASRILGKQIMYFAAAVLLIVSIVFLIYIPLSLRKICIYINEDSVILKSGIIISNERRINMEILELAYIIKTPFSKYTGINFTVLCVYGKRLILPFLSTGDAEEIMNIVHINITSKKEKSHET